MIIYWTPEIAVIDNSYFKKYINLMTKAARRSLKADIYYERHHVIPRSLNGNDSDTNIVSLTAKEHYIAHRLLTKFTTGDQRYRMLYALDAMGMQSQNTINRYRMPARVYERNKK